MNRMEEVLFFKNLTLLVFKLSSQLNENNNFGTHIIYNMKHRPNQWTEGVLITQKKELKGLFNKTKYLTAFATLW